MLSRPIDTAWVLLILFPSLQSSKLHHHPHPHPHPVHNHHSHLPHVTIGPYQPWKLDPEILTNIEEHPRVGGAGSHGGPSGYQTNIIIDPFSKVGKLETVMMVKCMEVLFVL